MRREYTTYSELTRHTRPYSRGSNSQAYSGEKRRTTATKEMRLPKLLVLGLVPKAGFDLDHFNFSSIDEEFTGFGIGFNRLRHTIE